MKNVKFIVSILLLSVTMIATHAVAGSAKKCNVKVKSCLDSSSNKSVVLSIFKGNDGSHTIAHKTKSNVLHGSVWSTECAWDNCDIEINYDGNIVWKYDYCGDFTVRHVSRTNASIQAVDGQKNCI